MKRKLPSQATTTTLLTATSPHHQQPPRKHLRSNLPRRPRTHISPILLLHSLSSSSPKLKHLIISPSLTSCDNISCNTSLESFAQPPHHHRNTATSSAPQNDAVSKPHLKCAAVSLSLSPTSCVESCSVITASAVAAEDQAAESKPPLPNSNSTLSPSTATVNFFGTDLACTENLSSFNDQNDDDENLDDLEVTSELDVIISSQFDDDDDSLSIGFTDEYTPSLWLNYSGSQFSEKSVGDDVTPSPCFSLFKEFLRQFASLPNSTAARKSVVSSIPLSLFNDDLSYWRFEEEEDEESYACLRRRERKNFTKVTDYADEYDFATHFGSLIAEQRLLMVNWIIEISRKKNLQNETLFLGVCLFDRFLSKGYFTSRRNLQLLGISCLTLAIRIEENQPYNCVRQKCFYVENNFYSRTEVVAMEWVVQEILKFQCLSPTIYNFLWFYLKAAEADEEMRMKANHLACLALLDHRKLQYWPSTVSAAVVILASLSVNQDESCQRVMQAHVRTKYDDLPECVKSLEWLVKYAR